MIFLSFPQYNVYSGVQGGCLAFIPLNTYLIQNCHNRVYILYKGKLKVETCKKNHEYNTYCYVL